ncbi:MAG TPA: hypothetical protein VNF71_03495 [Acidimicrobiales bacterium]|nr:hypothetical protein [Acidimicrobiales bacterium]
MNLRRTLVIFAVAAICLSAVVGLLATSAGTSHRSKVGYPNFVCVAAWNVVGLCIGPPTKQV